MSNNIKKLIQSGKTALGIEFGSTRIKAILVDENNNPIASGAHDWENRYENGIWTYTLEDIWTGLQDCYANMATAVEHQYGIKITWRELRIASGGMHELRKPYLILFHPLPSFM